MDTIFAPLTPKGRGSIFVVRISGSKVIECMRRLGIGRQLKPREVSLCSLKDGDDAVDEALVTYFQSPNSFTGEDICEISLHCSQYIISKIFRILSLMEGVRFADRGEFSKRAFLNGRMDLMQAEGIADLINAETELQHAQAIGQLKGRNSNVYNGLRKDIVEVLSLCEAYIDFPEDELPSLDIKDRIDKIISAIRLHLNDNKVGERIRDGFHIAIIGEPNVGKSSLLNYLAKREVAIVSAIAGTTRDVLEVNMDINGIPVILYDTAGIRDCTDIIEQEGVCRAIKTAQNADIKVLMVSPDNPHPNDKIMELVDEQTIIILNKSDLGHATMPFTNYIAVSLKDNTGLDLFVSKLQEQLDGIIFPNANTAITNERHRGELQAALSQLELFSINKSLEINAEYLRLAGEHIGRITGKVSVNEILDNIFSKFCIGK